VFASPVLSIGMAEFWCLCEHGIPSHYRACHLTPAGGPVANPYSRLCKNLNGRTLGMIEKRSINAADAPEARGGYAQALEIGNAGRMLHISGLIPVMCKERFRKRLPIRPSSFGET